MKKNIYVYDREAPEDDAFKKSRTGSVNSSKKSSFSTRYQNLENPFEKKSRLRNRLL